MRRSVLSEFTDGAVEIAPVLVAAAPIGLLWGTLAVAKGLSPFEAGLFSIAVFAGAAQFVAIDLWRDPVPWLMLTATVFVVNLRLVLMGASLARHMKHIRKSWRLALVYYMADENWAFSERRARMERLTVPYYLGLTLPMVVAWTVSTVIGALAGRTFGDPAAYGFDFAFSALFISILAGFWKGPATGAVLLASLVAAVVSRHLLEGPWYIVLGGLAGVLVAALLHPKTERA